MTSLNYSRYYSRWNDGSIKELDRRKSFYSKLLDNHLVEYSDSSHVLDFGCGFGALTYYLLSKFKSVSGIDASPHQVLVAQKNGLPVHYLPIENFDGWAASNKASFDIIFLMDVFEHIPVANQIIFLSSITSTLKSGGKIFIKVPNASSPMASRWRYNDSTHFTSFTEHSLEIICDTAGLVDIQYLCDDSSMNPLFSSASILGCLRFFLKCIFRLIWRIYLISEQGSEALNIPLGLNLFISARKS